MSEAVAHPADLPPLGRRASAGRIWEIVWLTASADYRRRYAGSVLGYAWAILRPLMLFAVLYAVFTRVIRFGGEVPNYPMLLFFNIVLYFFFQEGTMSALRSFVAHGSIIRNASVPLISLPLSAVLTVAFVFVTNMIVVVTWMLFYGIEPQPTWFLVPLLLVYLAGVTIAFGVLLGSLFVRFRDVLQFWAPFVRLLFYASPIVFPFEFIPEGALRSVAALNPLSPLFVEARAWVIEPGAPSWPEAAGSTAATIAPFAVAVLAALAATLTYRRMRSTLAETI